MESVWSPRRTCVQTRWSGWNYRVIRSHLICGADDVVAVPAVSGFGGFDSGRLNSDVVGVFGQCAETGGITGEHGSCWFGEGDHEGVDRRAMTRLAPQFGGPPSEGRRHVVVDDAGLEKPIRVGVWPRPTLERLD